MCLHVHRVTGYEGTAVGVEGQQVRWAAVSELSSLDFPSANRAIIKSLLLPERYLITGKFKDPDDFLEKLQTALQNNISLVQLRLKAGQLSSIADVQPLVEQSSILCKNKAARLMINIAEDYRSALDLSRITYSGVHADSRMLMTLSEGKVSALRSNTEDKMLLSASCHTAGELERAVQLGADFVVLSPVQKTMSHPDMEPIGWQKFSEMVRNVQIPVYALGGVSESDIAAAWSHGGQGVAAISAYWKS